MTRVEDSEVTGGKRQRRALLRAPIADACVAGFALCAGTGAYAQSLPIAKSDNDFSACMSMPQLKAAMAKEDQSVIFKGKNFGESINLTANKTGKGYILSFHGPADRPACPVARTEIARAFDPAKAGTTPPPEVLLGTNPQRSLAACRRENIPSCGDHDTGMRSSYAKGVSVVFMGYQLDDNGNRRNYITFKQYAGNEGYITVTYPSGASDIQKDLKDVVFSKEWVRYFEKPVQTAAPIKVP